MTQVQLAAAMGTEQTRVSELERQADWRLSTLTAYLLAASATATLSVDTPSGAVSYTLTSDGRWVVQ